MPTSVLRNPLVDTLTLVLSLSQTYMRSEARAPGVTLPSGGLFQCSGTCLNELYFWNKELLPEAREILENKKPWDSCCVKERHDETLMNVEYKSRVIRYKSILLLNIVNILIHTFVSLTTLLFSLFLMFPQYARYFPDMATNSHSMRGIMYYYSCNSKRLIK